ncbi:MAG TPA: sigma 54-interacting transcriptional regulator [Polyangiaceae bacterium]|jgi:transcriptional regulator with GAF, ATPase, and Fis domain
MSGPLSSQQEPDLETLWRAMRALVDRLFAVLDGDTMLDDALDILVEILGADRGLVLVQQQDGTLRAINARGHKKGLTAEEREEISRTIVREARETGRCVVWDVASDPASSESVNLLGILAALAAPLQRGAPDGDGARGVLYLDFRDHRKFVQRRHVEFFMSAATLLAAVTEQSGLGRRAREHLREAKANLVDARRAPPLDDLLAAPSMAGVRREVEAALHGDSPVLILGESGTGKTLLAQAIAEASGRRPIVRAMLGASDDLNTITSELFGHERGAYSGATGKRAGLVEFADGGTLIFDEILNLPAHAQRLLLDFTQFGTYRPLGYERAEPKRASVRLIAATNGDLRVAIHEGRFREDLYHRLAGITLDLPPLRERREDVPLLAERALRRADPARPWTLSLPLRRLLLSPAIPWSGNVRQLERVIVRARDRAVSRDGEAATLTPEHIEARDLEQATMPAGPSGASGPPDAPGVVWQRLQAERGRIDEREASVIRDALTRNDGVIAHAARELGIARTTLSDRINALGLRVR